MTIEAVSGKIVLPRRIIFYGVEGIGKSTWCSTAPNAIFVPTEDGTNDLDVQRFPFKDEEGKPKAKATSFDELMGGLGRLYEEKHPYKTLVVDSLDQLEKLIFAAVCANYEKKVNSIEEIGYAKGYDFALPYWKQFMDAIDYLRIDKGMTAILIAHSQIVRFEHPEIESYDRFTPRIHKKGLAMLKDWSDEILFATYKTYTKTTGEGFQKKSRGIGTGERVIYTSERPGHEAKNRLGLPDELPMLKENGWATYAAYLGSNGKKTATKKEEVKSNA